MIDIRKINRINSVVETFFKDNNQPEKIPANFLMPQFIKAGIFAKDIKSGKPLRDVLKDLDRTDELHLIPYLHAERIDEIHTYWYFVVGNASSETAIPTQQKIATKKELAIQARLNSDENYVIGLCNTALDLMSVRQKKFEFLLGDMHKDGHTRTMLPVDAYYESLKLAIEYDEMQIRSAAYKNNNATISGVNRNAQRKIYDKRKATELAKNEIKLIVISHQLFNCNEEHKIIRNPEEDLQKIEEILKSVK